ncbi:unnamed protein product [Nesidiocoris tenuis]|uniref:Uncharacterized protein n=1 Tax=Nesidiocoris tenuis TaxID=355587 RepID=A0A6H5HRI6_9HEMI|nr:unnamed protein product [Nesidiocoris tenuis]
MLVLVFFVNIKDAISAITVAAIFICWFVHVEQENVQKLKAGLRVLHFSIRTATPEEEVSGFSGAPSMPCKPGVVEGMAVGQIMVSNRSGGPKADIIEESEGSRNGFLALDETEYARAISAIIKLGPAARKRIREAARFEGEYL